MDKIDKQDALRALNTLKNYGLQEGKIGVKKVIPILKKTKRLIDMQLVEKGQQVAESIKASNQTANDSQNASMNSKTDDNSSQNIATASKCSIPSHSAVSNTKITTKKVDLSKQPTHYLLTLDKDDHLRQRSAYIGNSLVNCKYLGLTQDFTIAGTHVQILSISFADKSQSGRISSSFSIEKKPPYTSYFVWADNDLFVSIDPTTNKILHELYQKQAKCNCNESELKLPISFFLKQKLHYVFLRKM